MWTGNYLYQGRKTWENPALVTSCPNNWDVSKLDPLILVSSTSHLHTIVLLIPTRIMRRSFSRTHDGSLWPPHFLQTPLTGFSKPSHLADVTLTISYFGNSSPARPFFSPCQPSSHIPCSFLPRCFCWYNYFHILCCLFLSGAPGPTNLLLAVPTGVSLSLDYCCLASLPVGKKRGLRVNYHFIWHQ